DSTSVFHQGQELTFHSKSGSMAAIFTCLTTSNEGLAKWGRPSMTNPDLISPPQERIASITRNLYPSPN
ncbi:MAG: hypothetical protein KJ702_02680, partial [Gammaproteobacteria bacterium]|nr:hypothetical protein [Gammaproteobacteria bacterium]